MHCEELGNGYSIILNCIVYCTCRIDLFRGEAPPVQVVSGSLDFAFAFCLSGCRPTLAQLNIR